MVTGAPLQPGHPERIEGEMRELLAWIENNAMAVPAVAAEAHYRLVKIHPFRDGNGRTARLLMNWILLNGGYKLTVIPSEQRARYITSIDEADRGNPQEYFQFLFECIEHSLDQYLEAR